MSRRVTAVDDEKTPVVRITPVAPEYIVDVVRN
jgi:hypothetical protein